MSKQIKRTIVIATVIAALLVVFMFLNRASGRSTLERYKAELRAKGEKLTFKEIAATPSTNAEDVAARNVLAAYSSNYSSLSSGYYPHTMDYVIPGKARVAWQGQLRLDGGGTAATAEWNALESDNQRAAPALALIRPALVTSPPDSGRIYDDDFTNIITVANRDYIRDRIIAQALQRDAIGELHRGNLDAALEDLHALTGQARMNRDEPTLVGQMIRGAITGLALNTTWEALQAPGWDEPRLAGLQRDWDQLELLDALRSAFEAERAMTQVIMAEVRRSGVDPIRNAFKGGPGLKPPVNTFRDHFKVFMEEDFPWLVYRITGSANADEMTQLEFSTRSLELMRSLKSGRPWPEVGAGFTNLIADLDHKIGAERFHRSLISAMALPNLARPAEAIVHSETQRRLTIAAIAIKRYELKHGQPPPTLAALTPEFLAKVPMDLMSGKELQYHLGTNGGFVLYSVGDDGKDNGGKAGMGLWSGLDAVWPIATTPEEESVLKGTVTKK